MIILSTKDLINAFGAASNSVIRSDFSIKLKEEVQKALIINIYLNNGELIKIGDGSLERVQISDIVNISNDFFTVRYDSHDTDILFSSISKIEYFY